MSRESEKVGKALTDLEAELRRVSSPVVRALRPGLAAADFRRLTKSLPFAPGESLAAVYAWHDGSDGSGPAEELFPGGRFAPLARAVQSYHLEVSLADWFKSDWFPLFYDDGGRPEIVTKGGDGVVLVLDRADPNGTVEEAASLSELLAQLVSRYRAGAYARAGAAIVEQPGVLSRLRRRARGTGPDVERLVADIQGSDGEARVRAAQEILRHKYVELVEPLIGLLSSPNSEVRREGALLLGEIGDPRAVPHLIRAIAEWEGKDFFSAWGGLHAMGGQGVIARLEAALRDGDPGLRVLAARALGTSQDATAVPALQAAANDSDARVSEAAQGALRRLRAS